MSFNVIFIPGTSQAGAGKTGAVVAYKRHGLGRHRRHLDADRALRAAGPV